jgi:hypothetical protein
VERDRSAWKVAGIVVVALLTLYAIAQFSGVVTVVASRF